MHFSTLGYLLSLLIKRVMLAKISTWVLAIAFIFLTLNLLVVIDKSCRLTSLGSRSFLIFCLGGWRLSGFPFKTKTRLLGAFISPFILLLMIAAAGQETGKSLLPENLQGWLTTLHLVFAIIGEALFVLASCAGAMFIIQNGLLKHKKLGKMSRLLPSLSDLDRINHLCLLWGFPLLTIGIIAGAVFAGLAWKAPGCGSENHLVFCGLGYLWISVASASGHWLEGYPDGGLVLRGVYPFLLSSFACEILFYYFA